MAPASYNFGTGEPQCANWAPTHCKQRSRYTPRPLRLTSYEAALTVRRRGTALSERGTTSMRT